MTFPEWTKPGAYGAVGGAIVVSVLGFTWGGWTTAGSAQGLAQTFATQEVTSAMVPVCLNASATDPERTTKLATIQDTSSFGRSRAVMATGWATFPGADQPNPDLAAACLERLALDGS